MKELEFDQSYLSQTLDFVVAYDETDFLERLKPSAMLQYFQDSVEAHAKHLRITHEEMEAIGKFWVMSRLYASIDFYPPVGSKISVMTHPHKPGMAEAQRSFYLISDGKIFARAISKWCVLDIATKRICRCRDIMEFSDEQFCPEKATDFPAPINIQSVSDEFLAAKQQSFCVNISDLDENLHMNNARYADVMLNMCDLQQLKNGDISDFDIRFLAELKHNDNFVAKRYDHKTPLSSVQTPDQPLQIPKLSYIEGFLDQKPVFSAQFTWRTRI